MGVTFQDFDIDVSADDTLVFSSQRLKQEEVRAFKSPTCKKQLQYFLEVVATFHGWNPNISKLSEKIRKLNAKGIHFKGAKNLTQELDDEFRKFKKGQEKIEEEKDEVVSGWEKIVEEIKED